MKKQHLSSRNVKNIGSPCYDSFPNQYSSLPTKDDRSKPKRQSTLSGTNGAKLLTQGTLTKSTNVSDQNTPKVLSKCFIDNDTITMKRYSHGLNNSRLLRTIEDDKF